MPISVATTHRHKLTQFCKSTVLIFKLHKYTEKNLCYKEIIKKLQLLLVPYNFFYLRSIIH